MCMSQIELWKKYDKNDWVGVWDKGDGVGCGRRRNWWKRRRNKEDRQINDNKEKKGYAAKGCWKAEMSQSNIFVRLDFGDKCERLPSYHSTDLRTDVWTTMLSLIVVMQTFWHLDNQVIFDCGYADRRMVGVCRQSETNRGGDRSSTAHAPPSHLPQSPIPECFQVNDIAMPRARHLRKPII